jgi:NAD(P)-dependent dehydrogenase (short-subunit alcohol dehydrogenase family)
MTVELFGPVNLLHNNAALTDPTHQILDLGPTEVSLEVWNRALAVNLTGQFLLCKHTLPVMLSGGGGAIINMSSLNGVLGDVNGVAYSVSKAGVLALTRSVATKYGRRGIRCNAIAPGLVMTESVAQNLSEPVQAVWLDNLLVSEPGAPADIAAVVAFLASDDAAYINGQVITVDGGVSAHLPIFEGMRRLAQRRMPRPDGAPSESKGGVV